MQDRDFLHIENKDLREEYFTHVQKIMYVFELSSIISYYLAQYKKFIEQNDIIEQEKTKNTLLSILKMSGITDITESQAADPSFSSKVLSTLFNNVLFNYTNFIVKNSKDDSIKTSSLDEDILNLLVDEESIGEDPNKVFDLLYNSNVTKLKKVKIKA